MTHADTGRHPLLLLSAWHCLHPMLARNADATAAAAEKITVVKEMLEKMEKVYTYPEGHTAQARSMAVRNLQKIDNQTKRRGQLID